MHQRNFSLGGYGRAILFTALYILIIFAVFTVAARAEETSTSASANVSASTTLPKPPSIKPAAREVRGEIQQVRKSGVEAVKGVRQDAKADIKTMRADAKTANASSTPEERMDARKDLRTDVKERVGEMRQDIRTIRASTTEMIMAKREELKTLVKNHLADVKQFRKERKELFKGKSAEQKKELANDASDKVLKGFTERIRRMEEVAAKLGDAITRGQTAGKDMSAAAGALVEAKVKIATAKTSLESLKASIATTLSSETSKGIGSDVRGKMKGIVEQIRTAEKALRDTNKAIRVGLGLQAAASLSNTGIQATTTATTTTATTATTTSTTTSQ